MSDNEALDKEIEKLENSIYNRVNFFSSQRRASIDHITRQQEMSDNELIAEFMGGISHALDDGFGNIHHTIWFQPGNHPNPHCSAGTYKRPADLEYHLRWDWLMPVVEKVNEKVLGEYIPWADVMYSLRSAKINLVYQYVIQAIKWYNSQTPQ